MITHICRNFISYSIQNSKNHSSLFTLHSSISLRNFSSSSSSSSTSHPPSRSDSRVDAIEYLNTRHNFSAEIASKLSSICRSIDPEKCDSVISIFKNNGFSQTDLERIVVRRPNIISASPDKTVEPKIKLFLDSGFSPAETADLIVMDPGILNRSTDHLYTTIVKLKEILGQVGKVYKFLKVGRFPSAPLEKNVIPNINLLKSFGVKTEQILRYMSKYPRNFVVRTEKMMEHVKKAEVQLGFNKGCNMLLPAIRILGSMSKVKWESKLKVFRGLGFREDEIGQMIRRMPQVVGVSEAKMKEITQFLVSSGETDLSIIAQYPILLMFSLEKRLKPRLEVLEALRSRKKKKSKILVVDKHNLVTFCLLSNADFMNKVVLPHSDILSPSLLNSKLEF
ncbi:transcription termination factor MTERF9, chloroplastic-like [Impatiens glandulifera]|uniref:transcription termination factor MTERF9, chloroplastic-like n=1 Tax=Impatiens glandulifera TaxID=253017 RepID=UPI001FB10E0E|nr:transcription termination factor MTERF9, chloroplastic-like [Impatiens glandulifera]